MKRGEGRDAVVPENILVPSERETEDKWGEERKRKRKRRDVSPVSR